MKNCQGMRDTHLACSRNPSVDRIVLRNKSSTFESTVMAEKNPAATITALILLDVPANASTSLATLGPCVPPQQQHSPPPLPGDAFLAFLACSCSYVNRSVATSAIRVMISAGSASKVLGSRAGRRRMARCARRRDRGICERGSEFAVKEDGADVR
jgi:hypothetical protein